MSNELSCPATLSILSERIDDIVLLLHMMIQMELPQLLNEQLPRHWKQEGLDLGWVAVIWLSYILSEGDHRKVMVREWVNHRRQMLEQVCDIQIRETDFSDDRLSILLRHLSEPERWGTIESTLGRRLIRIYDLNPTQVHMDGTTISGHHTVDEQGLFQFGHSKDDPRLPQVKLMMGVVSPLGLPLATQVLSGQQADDGLYIPLFDQGCRSLESSGLLWVGDCKMAALATRSHIHLREHYYLMPLPKTGNNPALLDESLNRCRQEQMPLETLVLRKSDGSSSETVTGYCLTRPVEATTSEGYGVCWQEQLFLVHSDVYERQQCLGLEKRLTSATAKLKALTPPPGRGRKQIRERAVLEKKVQTILKSHHVEGLLDYDVCFHPATQTRQSRYEITAVHRHDAAIAQQTQSFGWRMYVSNADAVRLCFAQAVSAYRDEWLVENDFHRLKGKPLGARPVFVRRDDQIQGLMHLLSLALRVYCLIEFVVRRQLDQSQQALSGLGPQLSSKPTQTPTTEQLLQAFRNITLSIVDSDSQHYRYVPPLTPLQQTILELLGLSPDIYANLALSSR